MEEILQLSTSASSVDNKQNLVTDDDIDVLFWRIQAAVLNNEDENNEGDNYASNIKFLESVASSLYQKGSCIQLSDVFLSSFCPKEEEKCHGGTSDFSECMQAMGHDSIDAREVFSFLLGLTGKAKQLSSLYFFCVLIRKTFHQLALDMFRRNKIQFSSISVARRKARSVLFVWCGDLKETLYRFVFPSLSFFQHNPSAMLSAGKEQPISSVASRSDKGGSDILSSALHPYSCATPSSISAEASTEVNILLFFSILNDLKELFMDIAAVGCVDLVSFVLPLAVYFPVGDEGKQNAGGVSGICRRWCDEVMKVLADAQLLQPRTPLRPMRTPSPEEGDEPRKKNSSGFAPVRDTDPLPLSYSHLEAISFLLDIISEMPRHLSRCTPSMRFDGSQGIQQSSDTEESMNQRLIEEKAQMLESQRALGGDKHLNQEEQKFIAAFKYEERVRKHFQLYDFPSSQLENSTSSQEDLPQVYIGALALIQFLCETSDPTTLEYFISVPSILNTLFPVFYLCFDMEHFFCYQAQNFLIFLLDRAPLHYMMYSYSCLRVFSGCQNALTSLPQRKITAHFSSLHFLKWVKLSVEQGKFLDLGEDVTEAQECVVPSPTCVLLLQFWTLDTVVSSMNLFQRQYLDLLKRMVELSVQGGERQRGLDYQKLTVNLLTRSPPKEKVEFIFLLIFAAPHASVAQHFLHMLVLDWKKYQKSIYSLGMGGEKKKKIKATENRKAHFEVLFPQLLISGFNQLFLLIEHGGRADLIDTLIRFLNFFATVIAEDRRCICPSDARCAYHENGHIILQVREEMETSSASTIPQEKVWHGAVVALGACVLPRCEKLLKRLEEDPSHSLDCFSLTSILSHLRQYF